jgi:hypothetical protein
LILDDALVGELSRAVSDLLGPTAMSAAGDLGVSVEDTIRFLAVTRQCMQARGKAELEIRDLAKKLKVPQYRVRDIEAGYIRQIRPEVLRAYIEILGLTEWYAAWSRANPDLAERLRGGASPGFRAKARKREPGARRRPS